MYVVESELNWIDMTASLDVYDPNRGRFIWFKISCEMVVLVRYWNSLSLNPLLHMVKVPFHRARYGLLVRSFDISILSLILVGTASIDCLQLVAGCRHFDNHDFKLESRR
jgi:hypothetical protein